MTVIASFMIGLKQDLCCETIVNYIGKKNILAILMTFYGFLGEVGWPWVSCIIMGKAWRGEGGGGG